MGVYADARYEFVGASEGGGGKGKTKDTCEQYGNKENRCFVLHGYPSCPVDHPAPGMRFVTVDNCQAAGLIFNDEFEDFMGGHFESLLLSNAE